MFPLVTIGTWLVLERDYFNLERLWLAVDESQQRLQKLVEETTARFSISRSEHESLV